jgi:hypothetical protein
MTRMHVVTNASAVTETEKGALYVSASDLGLKPGDAPERLQLNLGSGYVTFTLDHERAVDDELMYWVYTTENAVLTVFND